MIICPVCKFRNPDANVKCFRCSALLKRDDDALKEAKLSAARKLRPMRIAQPVAAPIDWLRHRSWFRRIFHVPDDAPRKYPYTAGLLSLLPGAGHLYAGQSIKGSIIFVLWLAGVIFAIATIRAPWSNIVLFSLLILWLLVWADSIGVAAASNGDQWRFRKTLGLLFGAMMIVGVSVSVLQYLGVRIVQLERVTSDAMSPQLKRGDRLFFSNVPLWFRKPRVGEVVSYNPPRFIANQSSNIYSINISQYFQRVLAGPGDRIAKSGGTFSRNGNQLKDDDLPIGGAQLPDFDVIVPKDSYFIPVTGIPQDLFSGISGAGPIGYVGQPGYVFPAWPDFAIIPAADIRAKGYAIVSPPERRQLLKTR